MLPVTVHVFAAASLFAVTFIDAAFIRKSDLTLRSTQKAFAYLEMFLFIAAIGLGVAYWMPLMAELPASTYHSKLGIAFIYLVLSKIRLFKERKSGPNRALTWAMFGALCLNVILAYSA